MVGLFCQITFKKLGIIILHLQPDLLFVAIVLDLAAQVRDVAWSGREGHDSLHLG